MSERKVRQCKVCKEWFNVTDEIMVEHLFFNHNYISTIKLKLSCNDSAFTNQMKFVRSEICRAFGVPVGRLK